MGFDSYPRRNAGRRTHERLRPVASRTREALAGDATACDDLRDAGCRAAASLLLSRRPRRVVYIASTAQRAADAHASQVLGEPKGFLEGVAATSHPAFIDEIGGSLEETQPYTEGRVVWDANIITSRGPGTALEWSLCCVEAIFGRAKALEVAGPMVTQPAMLPPKRPFEWRLEEEVSSRVDRALEKYAN